MSRTLSSLALVAALLAPSAGHAQAPGYTFVPPPGPAAPIAPPPARESSRPIIGLAIAGGVMLGVSYLVHAALVSPLAGCDLDTCEGAWDDFRAMGFLPLAGPWAQLALRPNANRDLWVPYLIVDGVLQAGGLLMLVLGLTLRERVTQYGAIAVDDVWAIRPALSPGASGVALEARF